MGGNEIEGGASRDFLQPKALMCRVRGAGAALMGHLARAVTVYLNAQIAAGAQAVQLFDSWAGTLGPDDYRQYVLPFVGQIVAGITPEGPVVSFGTGNPQLIPLFAESGAKVICFDRRV